MKTTTYNKQHSLRKGWALFFLALLSFSLYGQSADQNYIRTRTMTNEAGTTFLDVVQYYDGLGRPIETVQVGVTPDKRDLVSYQTYDGFGRPQDAWLPAVAGAGNNGKFVPYSSFQSLASSTYNNTTINSIADNMPYSRTIYENSPLSRVIQEFGPGKDWHNNGKSVNTEYATNTSLLTIPYFYCDDIRTNITIRRNGNYGNNQLYITITTDEEGNEYLEAKDKLGRVVCTRQKDGNTYFYTSYVYDSYGCLKAVLPPEAVKIFTSGSWSESSVDFKNWVYAYKYNERNLCTAKKIPGAEWIYYVYDKGDRLIFTQDGERRMRDEWLFSIPDALGRVVLTGICRNPLIDANGYTDAYTSITTSTVTATRNNSTGIYKGYTVNISLTLPQVLTADYYDDYSFMGQNGIPGSTDADYRYESEAGYGTRYTGGHKGLLTGRYTAVLGDNNFFLYDIMYYDSRGRMIQSKSRSSVEKTNTGRYVDKEYIAYNFNDQPVKRKLVHINGSKNTETEVYDYEYDHALRLKKTKHTLNANAGVTLSDNTYDALGRLKTSVHSNKYGLRTDNKYNIRSWLTETTNTGFTEKLTYKYNGNIATQQWNENNSDPKTNKYTFSYDGLSRLKNAQYSPSSSNYNSSGHFDDFSASYSYDMNGNMTALSRNRFGSSGSSIKVDDLTFTHNGNQLKNVSDKAPTATAHRSKDFKDYSKSTTATEYVFNRNGAMTKDLNKGISNISYNAINLPMSMDIVSPVAEAKNSYLYTARGEKIESKYLWNSSYSTTPVIGSMALSERMNSSKVVQYAKNKVYENGSLKRILLDNGYYEGGKYYFFFCDHLGSIRSISETDRPNQKFHYYPFGMPYPDGSYGEPQPAYRYNGKELDYMHGLDLYDYSARYYDFTVGSFTTVDPLAEKYYSISPYAYCLNNPMRFVDPDGRDVRIYYRDEDNKQRSWVFNGSNQDKAPKNQFVSDFITAYNYNVENGGGDKIQAAATSTEYTLNLVQTDGGSNFETTFNRKGGTEGTVFWNPSEGLETPKGTLSPATILEHEFDHGVEWQTNTPEHIKNKKTSDPHFKNMEERRVIMGSEYKTGVANGELKPIPMRRINQSSSYRKHGRNSGNVFVPVVSPISNKKKP